MEKEVIDAEELSALNLTYDHNTSIFKPLVYHATFMRIKRYLFSRPEFTDNYDSVPEKKYDASFLVEKTKDHKFSVYSVNRIDISTRFEFDEDQFYKKLASIDI